jgi:hypothetical protein
MSQVIPGVIHGKTIELIADPGLGDGQPVEVFIRATSHGKTSGEGIRRSAGAWWMTRIGTTSWMRFNGCGSKSVGLSWSPNDFSGRYQHLLCPHG